MSNQRKDIVMKNLFNRMKNRFINIGERWSKKTYQEKNRIGSFLQIAVAVGLLLCIIVLNAPILQLVISLGLIAVASSGLIAVASSNLLRTLKYMKRRNQEENEKLAELAKRNAERKLAEYQKEDKRSYDKDTQEALQSLFSGNKNSDDAALMEVEKDDKNDVQTFSNTFNK